MNINKHTICDLLLYRAKNSASKNAIGYIENSNIHFYDFNTYLNTVKSLSTALLSIGLNKHSKVCILAHTRIEWHLLDLSILCSGAISVPVFPSYVEKDIQYIIDHSEAEFLIIDNLEQFKKIISISSNLKNIKRIITIEKIPTEYINQLEIQTPVMSFESLHNLGVSELTINPDKFEITIETISTEDLATIVYTSGTTGKPKGAMIKHIALYQVLQNIDQFSHNAFHEGDRFLTYLPLSHILGRCESFLTLLFGCQTVYAQSIEKLINNIQLVKPTLMTGVPRIFEKIYEQTLSKFADNPVKKSIFEFAMKTADEYYESIDNDRTPSTKSILSYQLVKKMVFQNIYNQLGGKIRYFISGGAPLSVEIIKFLRNSGLTVLEGYGLTETIAPCFINPLNKQIPGTVGQPIGDVEIKIQDDGEILIRSIALFSGYYKNTESTNEILDENNWFHTGDIGEINSKGFLKITGRKKDLIITSNGKNISPSKIENLLKTRPYITHALIIGERRKYITALICIEKASILHLLDELEIPEDVEIADLAKHPGIVQLIENEVQIINEQLPNYEMIKKFRILPSEVTVTNYLTPSLKLKRQKINAEFKNLINAMYQ